MKQILLLAAVVVALFAANQQWLRPQRSVAVAQTRVDSAQQTAEQLFAAAEGTPTDVTPATASPVLRISVKSVQPGKAPTTFDFKLKTEEQPVLLSELLFFLDRVWKNDRPYVLDEYDCKHFAYQLYEDAAAKGMAVRFVAMTLRDSEVGHAFNAFLTRDAGVVFVDFTAALDARNPARSVAQKNLVYAAPGEPYIRIPLAKLGADFRNRRSDFYAKVEAGQAFVERLGAFNLRQQDVEARRRELDERRATLARRPAALPDAEVLAADYENWNEEAKAVNHEARELKQLQSEWARNDWTVPDSAWIAETIQFIPLPFDAAPGDIIPAATLSAALDKTPAPGDPQRSIASPNR